MWHVLYQLTLGALSLVAAPILLLRRRRHYTSSLIRRLGFDPPSIERKEERIWIHAVSVGEVGVAATLLPHLPSATSVLVTTVTPTGQERALERFPEALVTYLPFDFGFAVRAFLDRFQPRLLILTEGDLWPTVLRQAKKRQIPILVINGRVSDRSHRRMRRLRPLLGPLLQPVDRFGVQSGADRDRLLDLGVPPQKIVVTGNLKFDSPEPQLARELETLLGRLAGDRALLVAGSTMNGEEEVVLTAFKALRAQHDAVLILAPRHPERWDSVASLIERTGFRWARRSALDEIAEPVEIVLLDSLGELAGLFRLATAAFIGGTIVPTGGHNPLEAARFAVPVIVGPSMENFLEIAGVFDAARAWQRIADGDDLAACWSRWLSSPEEAAATGIRGSKLVAEHRGALARTIEMLDPWLQRFEEQR
jgi:3-deoxy-D-manno-octulosonic-acid transferase